MKSQNQRQRPNEHDIVNLQADELCPQSKPETPFERKRLRAAITREMQASADDKQIVGPKDSKSFLYGDQIDAGKELRQYKAKRLARLHNRAIHIEQSTEAMEKKESASMDRFKQMVESGQFRSKID